MPGGIRSKLNWRVSKGRVVGLSLLVLISVMIISGFAGDIARAMFYRLPSGGLGAAPIYDGPASLEERILESDVVARIKLLSMSPTVEAFGDERSGDSAYVSALEFRFEVIEYLKGGGGNEIVGIVYGNDYYESRLGSVTFGEDLTDTHDMTWDDREAIVFLSKGRGVLSTLEERNRYVLGFADYGVFDSDSYTIDSRYAKRWLPAAESGGAAVAHRVGSGGDEQRFLTGVERAEGESREELINYQVANSAHNKALGTGGDSTTITLSQIRGLIAELQSEIDAGDGSPEYSQCVVEKYRWYSEVEHHAHGGGYETDSYDHELGSGLPADTVFALGTRSFDPPDDYDPSNHEYTNPHFELESWLGGDDAHLFQVADGKSVIATNRPLPKGQYRLYLNSREAKYIPCDAYPDAWRTWLELVVQVTTPQDALHEAFFDTVDIDESVGAGGENGALQPEWFETDDGESVIERIVWRDGQVEMELSPPAADLDDHRVDFIALDGSVALRLDFGNAVAFADDENVATLAWGVCGQPWADGDLLMLRIAEGIPDDGVQTTNDPDCLVSGIEQTSAPAAVSTPEPEPTTDPTPTFESTAIPEPTATPEPTAAPEPEPTAESTPTPEPTPTAEPTVESTPVPMPTETPIPNATPEAETSAEPMATLVPAEDAPASLPPAPENLTAIVNEDGTVTLSWDAPEDESIKGYQILRQRPTLGEDELSVYVEDSGSTDTTYIDVEVTAGIRHVYQVRAINANGASESSNSVQVGP